MDGVMEEKYVLHCPRCGRVEGFLAGSNDEPDETPEAEGLIEKEVVRTPAGLAVRLRCPRCGQWIKPDRATPA
jgi:uncharacterized C2H2 Zn-finger protein